MSHPTRRLMSLALLALQASACVTWQRPKTSLAPAGYVATEQPAVLLVLTRSGGRVQLRNPLVAGDSLVSGQATDTTWEDAPVSVARAEVSDLLIVKGDERGYEIVEVLMADGRAVQLRRPEIRADSIAGVVPVARAHRQGVRLADIAQVRVKRGDAALTTLAAVAGAAVIGVSAVFAAFLAEIN